MLIHLRKNLRVHLCARAVHQLILQWKELFCRDGGINESFKESLSRSSADFGNPTNCAPIAKHGLFYGL
jgi:hypothetical protein